MSHSPLPRVEFNLLPLQTKNSSGSTVVYGYDYKALLMSQGNPRLPNGKWAGGGPFYTYKESYDVGGGASYDFRVGSSRFSYKTGGVSPFVGTTTIPKAPTPYSTDQITAGLANAYATGYARARPGKPQASVGQFLAELRDFPAIPFRSLTRKGKFLRKTGGVPIPMVPKVMYNRLLDFRLLGSEYLNVVFGWAPFLRDLQSMYFLWQDIDKKLGQIIRDNGKTIRRRATIDDSQSTTYTASDQQVPWLNVSSAPPAVMAGSSAYRRTTVTKTKTWFAGAFRYYIPDLGSSQWTARARSALFGLTPTPELLWELMPWSWLIDWFSNVGDVMSNISPNAVENLTTQYSYAMRHVTFTDTASVTVQIKELHNATYDFPNFSDTLTSFKKIETKFRGGGMNPFGTGVSLPSLSLGQGAILAALGLSRGLVK